VDRSVSIGIHVPSVAVAGLQSGQAYAEFFQQVDAGITHLMLGVPTLDHSHLRRLAQEVARALRA